MIAGRRSQIAISSAIVCYPLRSYGNILLRSSAILRSRSQTIAEDRTMFYLLRSSAIICDQLRLYDHMETKILRPAIETHPIIFRVLFHDSTLVVDCRNGLRHECVYYRSRRDFNGMYKNKKASYWDKIGQKIHLSAEEAKAKFLQLKNCIRSLSNPKPMFSTVLELATSRLIITNRRSKFACSKISALPRSRCCLLFNLHARVYLTFSLTKTNACDRLCDRCDHMETAFYAIVCDCLRSAIVCDHMETSLKFDIEIYYSHTVLFCETATYSMYNYVNSWFERLLNDGEMPTRGCKTMKHC